MMPYSVGEGFGVCQVINSFIDVQYDPVAVCIANALISFSMLPDITQYSHPFRSTGTLVVFESLILVDKEIDGLLQISFNFQKATHAKAFRLVCSLIPEAIMDPRYLNLDTCFIELSINLQWWLRTADNGYG